MSLCLDTSALLPTVVLEPATTDIQALLEETSEPLLVSTFAIAEAVSAISRLVRTGFLEDQDARNRLASLDAWVEADAEMIDVLGADVRRAGEIVRKFELGLRAPDALHLAICSRLEAALVTLDGRLAAAARSLDMALAELA